MPETMSAWSNEEMADSTQNTQGFASNGENPFGIVGYGIDSYGQAFADVYDAWYQDLGDDDFVALVAASLPTRPVRILELGIGTGRLVTALQSLRGDIADHIVGIDSSTAMLDIARRNLSPMVNLVHGDFTEHSPKALSMQSLSATTPCLMSPTKKHCARVWTWSHPV